MDIDKPYWRAEPRDKSVFRVLVICIAILVFVVILGFGPDLLARALSPTFRWCNRLYTTPETFNNSLDLLFLGQFLNYSSSLSAEAAVPHFSEAVPQCGSAAPWEQQCRT